MTLLAKSSQRHPADREEGPREAEGLRGNGTVVDCFQRNINQNGMLSSTDGVSHLNRELLGKRKDLKYLVVWNDFLNHPL